MMILLAAYLLYTYLTRYREDWDALLRKWTQPPDDNDGTTNTTPR